MNKSTKIWINYAAGVILSVLLLYLLYLQLQRQLARVGPEAWWDHGAYVYLVAGLLLLPVNLGLEAWKWHRLAAAAAPLPVAEAVRSYLAGLAFSAITPNRIGEYPGRILYLKRKNTMRLISVSVLGMCAQLSAVMIAGVAGLIYYNIAFPGLMPGLVLAGTLLLTTGLLLLYLRFERWAPRLEGMRWLRLFRTYTSLLRRFTVKEQAFVLLLSVLRVVVFTAQYLIFLAWMQVDLPPVAGFFTAVLFFWALAVIPSIALAELGIRGHVSLWLFAPYSDHAIGIMAATVLLWFVNILLPSAAGSLLWAVRKRRDRKAA